MSSSTSPPLPVSSTSRIDPASLSPEQRAAVFAVTERLALIDKQKWCHPLLCHGPGGCGKSRFVHFLQQEFEDSVVTTATTGSAAVLLGNGSRTVHSMLSIGRGDGTAEQVLKFVQRNPETLARLRAMRILVVDEISMAGVNLIDLIYAVTTHFGPQPMQPYGGILVIYVGDFFQLPPVVSRVDVASWKAEHPLMSEQAMPRYAFESSTWRDYEPTLLRFVTNYRQSGDRRFVDLLLRVRRGRVEDDDISLLMERCVPPSFGIDDAARDGMTIVFTKKDSVRAHNEFQLNKLTGELHEYELEVRIDPFWDKDTPRRIRARERAAEVVKGSPYEQTLALREHTPVILVRNLCFDAGGELINGSRGVVVGFGEKHGYPIVRFNNGVEMEVFPEAIDVKEKGSTMAKVYQVPLILGWAITLHKCQGMTLSEAVIDLDGVFDKNMVYVALSRVRSLQGLRIRGFRPESIQVDPKVEQYLLKLARKTTPLVAQPSALSIPVAPVRRRPRSPSPPPTTHSDDADMMEATATPPLLIEKSDATVSVKNMPPSIESRQPQPLSLPVSVASKNEKTVLAPWARRSDPAAAAAAAAYSSQEQ